MHVWRDYHLPCELAAGPSPPLPPRVFGLDNRPRLQSPYKLLGTVEYGPVFRPARPIVAAPALSCPPFWPRHPSLHLVGFPFRRPSRRCFVCARRPALASRLESVWIRYAARLRTAFDSGRRPGLTPALCPDLCAFGSPGCAGLVSAPSRCLLSSTLLLLQPKCPCCIASRRRLSRFDSW
jgi:hypothetical protein